MYQPLKALAISCWVHTANTRAAKQYQPHRIVTLVSEVGWHQEAEAKCRVWWRDSCRSCSHWKSNESLTRWRVSWRSYPGKSHRSKLKVYQRSRESQWNYLMMSWTPYCCQWLRKWGKCLKKQVLCMPDSLRRLELVFKRFHPTVLSPRLSVLSSKKRNFLC